MARFGPRLLPTALVLGASLGLAAHSQALEIRCARDLLVRDIEVRFARDADGLPCEVIWRSDLRAGERDLVWRSDTERDFCTDKARELVLRLIDGGWTCNSPDPAYAGYPALPAEPAVPDADAALPLEAEREPPAAPTLPAPTEPARPEQAILQAALARDVARLDQLAGSAAGFEADMAQLGDLDGDGVAEAVALLTHRAAGGPPSLHLLAYRFDGKTFQPVARRALADAAGAEIRGVADGVIEVIAHVAQPGDAACCPSGRHSVSFVLRGGELVRLPEDEPRT